MLELVGSSLSAVFSDPEDETRSCLPCGCMRLLKGGLEKVGLFIESALLYQIETVRLDWPEATSVVGDNGCGSEGCILSTKVRSIHQHAHLDT